MTEKFLGRKYHKEHYNCAHFLADVWLEITGVDIKAQLTGFLLKPSDRFVTPDIRRSFRRIEKPESPCIVLMQRKNHESHVGVFWKRKILHMNESGAHYHDPCVALFGFTKVGYYQCQNAK